jgi:predicted RNA binding protein YcfA (HicA-like mRNA interferase family)
MKRAKFIKYLNQNNCGFVKHGGRHDKYINHNNGKKSVIPRHSEIDEYLCELICKQLDIPVPNKK